ncbi:MATE family efflux transporter [Candidatus Epulonipiscioides saccharophilum]|nr:MATE family efflux transporter [Epulopiscium sp. SCG-B10WGA-EpuloB]
MMLIREKQFYKTVLSISIPMMLQNLIGVAVGLADTLMLGRLGEVELTSAALSQQFFFIFMVMNFGLGGGTAILISQYWGKQDVPKIRTIMGIMYKVSISLSIMFMIVSLAIPRQIISVFTTDIRVIDIGEQYLRILSISYIFSSFSNCSMAGLRAIKTVRVSVVIYSISLLLNIFLNWILIFGNLGAPQLGVVGAAIATVIARITESVLIIIFLKFFDKKMRLGLDILKRADKYLRKDFIKIVTPVVINEMIWSVGSSMISIIVGRMGTEVVAANTIANVVNQCMTVIVYAVSGASSVIIGNSIGAKEYERTKGEAFTLLICVATLGMLAGVCVFIARPHIINFYVVTDLTKKIAMDIMLINSFIVVFQALANTLNVGILRAGGDTNFVLINDVIFMWLLAIPLGFIGAFVWDLPVILVFCIIRIDEILKSICATIRLLSFKWINNVTRE